MKNNKKGAFRVHLHFYKTLVAVLLLFSLAIGLLVYHLGHFDDNDIADYRELMKVQDGSDDGDSYVSRQQRIGLQKDALFVDHGQTLSLRLKSQKAELSLDHHDNRTEIVEQMNGITCYIQEELFYQLSDGKEATLQPNGKLLIRRADSTDEASWVEKDDPLVKEVQIVRFIEADTAFYYYKNDQFIAENVKLTRYLAQGHTIDQAEEMLYPMMSGLASWVEFSLGKSGMNFKAYKLNAKFHLKGS